MMDRELDPLPSGTGGEWGTPGVIYQSVTRDCKPFTLTFTPWVNSV